MNLQLDQKLFIVCGATSGFGNAVARLLVDEGANVIAVARTGEKLEELAAQYPGKMELVAGDITASDTIQKVYDETGNRRLDGILFNSGGPPAMRFIETGLAEWDEAYRSLLRWKIEMVQKFLPKMTEQQYGRFVFVESAAIKQPIENLVLSTSLRLSVTGFVKTLSQELPDKGVTFNILAPGYHYTPAVERLIKKKAGDEKIPFEQAKKIMEEGMPMKKTGNVDHFASLAVWLLSPLSAYVTGQVFAVDGGVIKATL